MDIRRDHEAEIAAPDQLQITMDVVRRRKRPSAHGLAIHGLAQQIEAFSLKLLPFFGRPIRPPSIKASLPPRMLFHLATELLFLLDTARLPLSSDLPEHFPSLTATLLLVSNLRALFRWQIPATLLPTARDRVAFGFQSRQPSRASRPHAR